MEFFKNFCKDDDKIIGLCAFKKKKCNGSKTDRGYDFGALKLVYEPKIQPNVFFF